MFDESQRVETVEPGAVKELERVMKEKFAANTSLRASKIGGVQAAAKIMNFTKTEMETRILSSIKKEDKDLMAEIQDNMFVFENLSSSDDQITSNASKDLLTKMF